ncbi:MAG: hypothetical protein ABI868_07775 [Acidobacteriota bacterium]
MIAKEFRVVLEQVLERLRRVVMEVRRRLHHTPQRWDLERVEALDGERNADQQGGIGEHPIDAMTARVRSLGAGNGWGALIRDRIPDAIWRPPIGEDTDSRRRACRSGKLRP